MFYYTYIERRRMKMNVFIRAGYSLTDDKKYRNKVGVVDGFLDQQLGSLYDEILDWENEKIIPQLIELIKTYPQTPILKVYLAQAYELRGDLEEAMEIADEMLTLHPHSPDSYILKATLLLENNDVDGAEELLGEKVDIRKLIPGREVFYIDELTDVLQFSVVYYILIGRTEAAKSTLLELEEVNPDCISLKSLEKLIETAIQRELQEDEMFGENEHELGMRVVRKSEDDEAHFTFNNDEVFALFINNANLPKGTIETLLSLPREALIEDLENMLEDAVRRFDFFDEVENDDMSTTFFVMHALAFLTELKAVESLPKVLAFLSSDVEIIDFYLGAMYEEFLWIYFFNIGMDQSDELLQFLYSDTPDLFVRSSVVEAMMQTALQKPKERDKMVELFRKILQHYIDKPTVDSVESSHTFLLAILIEELEYGKFIELLPQIKTLYKKGYNQFGLFDDIEEVQANMEESDVEESIADVLTIYEIYDSLKEILEDMLSGDSWDWLEGNDEDDNANLNLLLPFWDDKARRN